MNTIIGLLGPQGVGKGTVAKFLLKHYMELSHLISTGEIIRKRIEDNSEFRDQAAGILNNGHLLSDEEIADIIRGQMALGLKEEKTVFVLDGAPRTVTQSTDLMSILVDVHKIERTSVFYFELMMSRELSFQRMEQRVQEAINAGEAPRSDDTPEALERRLDKYSEFINGIRANLKSYGIGYNQIDVSTFTEEPSKRIASYITDFVGNHSHELIEA